jgi:uncharacterized protein (TIGR02145 family)
MKTLLVIVMLLLPGGAGIAQTKLEVVGDIQVGQSNDSAPAAGTIRWTGTDFIGWNGTKWISLTNGLAFDGMVTDVDGNAYRTIKIGNQEWMVDNLRTTRYADESVIPQVNNITTWQNTNMGAWSWYDTTNNYDLPYGKLYNWYAVSDVKGLCPAGWHVPTDAEWTVLVTFLDPGAVVVNGIQSQTAGGLMKESGLAHWVYPNDGASNQSGFTGLPGGRRTSNGVFTMLGFEGSWWTSTADLDNGWLRALVYNHDYVLRGSMLKTSGYSVRCLKN